LPVPTSSTANCRPAARGPQALQALDDRGDAAEALGHLDHHAGRVDPGALDRRDEPAVAVGVKIQRARRDVDEQQCGLRQLGDTRERLVDAERVELVHAPDLLCGVERLGGPGEPVVL
jgi:hypothetical protein